MNGVVWLLQSINCLVHLSEQSLYCIFIKKQQQTNKKNITLWFSCDWCNFWDPHIHLIKKAETHWEVTFGRHEGEAKKLQERLKTGGNSLCLSKNNKRPLKLINILVTAV